MAEHVEIDLAEEFALNSEVLQVLAGNPDTARMLVAGFRAQDHETFRAALRELELVDRCAYVCEWLCSKHCVLRCTQFCGPDAEHKEIGLDEWAAVVGRLTEQKELLTRLCHSFVEHNVDEFQATLKEAGLLAYCHYICHWICDTWCGLVCDLLCRPERPNAVIACRQLVLELQRTGEAVSVLARNPCALRELTEAAFVWDCEIVRGVFERLGLFGRCRWICSWRCVRTIGEPTLKSMLAFDEAFVDAGLKPAPLRSGPYLLDDDLISL